MRIEFREDLFHRLKNMDWATLRHGIWIYGLTDNNVIWYIGSTVSPCARLLEHAQRKTKDTAQRMTSSTVMTLLDLVSPEDRLRCEARWIASTPTACNTVRYDGLLQAEGLKTHADLLAQTLARMGL